MDRQYENYVNFMKRDGYENGNAELGTLGSFLNHSQREKIEKEEYRDYTRYIRLKNIISKIFLQKLDVKELRKLMNENNISRIDPHHDPPKKYFVTFKKIIPWNMEKILWVSCLKEDGLFGKIPVEILKNIIGIANEIEYHQNCKWRFYKTFVGKLQDKMLDQEISQNSIFKEPKYYGQINLRDKIPLLINKGTPDSPLDMVTDREVKNQIYDNLKVDIFFIVYDLYLDEYVHHYGNQTRTKKMRKGPYIFDGSEFDISIIEKKFKKICNYHSHKYGGDVGVIFDVIKVKNKKEERLSYRLNNNPQILPMLNLGNIQIFTNADL